MEPLYEARIEDIRYLNGHERTLERFLYPDDDATEVKRFVSGV